MSENRHPFETTTTTATAENSTSTNSETTSSFFHIYDKRSLSESEIEELTTAFQLFDHEKKGKISISEFQDVLHSLIEDEQDQEQAEQSPSPSSKYYSSFHLRELLNKLKKFQQAKHEQQKQQQHQQHRTSNSTPDVHHDDLITEEEFIELLTSRENKEISDDNNNANNIQRVFELFDRDNKGYITKQDLKTISIELGENMSDEELEHMIQRATLTTATEITTMSNSNNDANNENESNNINRNNNSSAADEGKVTPEQLQIIISKKLFS